MSAQTGSLPPPGPVSRRMVDRARFRVRLWETQPNPLWIRELRQSARLSRTPVILTVVTVLMILLIASIGGIVSTEASPSSTGAAIFQVFFSMAYFVVTLVGPAVAANSIASEREGRTWEAVLLTGLAPTTIARGKFLAAFTSIAMYIVMLAPVGALSFLFGGVTATEVVVAFAGLFLVALLSVAFGLAISSQMSSLRAAIVVTLLLAFPLSIAAFGTFGFGLSYAAHRAWPGVADGPPIWLPAAYARAPFDLSYVVFLVILPVLSVTLPAWFLYEVTISNLTSVTDDRSSGLKRWFVVAAPALTATAVIPAFATSSRDRVTFTLFGVTALFFFFVFCVFLFMGDPIGPSRRVVIDWDRRRRGAVARFLGPGVVRSAVLLLVVGWASLSVLGLAAMWAGSLTTWLSGTATAGAALYSGYALGFFVFVVGLGAFLRARSTVPLMARIVLFAALFGVSLIPWVIAAVAGVIRDHGGPDNYLAIAAPSPFYVFVMFDAVGVGHDFQVTAGVAAMLGWALLGIMLLGAASRRCAGIIRRHEAVLAEGDRLLAAEDAAAARAAAAREELAADLPAAEPVEG